MSKPRITRYVIADNQREALQRFTWGYDYDTAQQAKRDLSQHRESPRERVYTITVTAEVSP